MDFKNIFKKLKNKKKIKLANSFKDNEKYEKALEIFINLYDDGFDDIDIIDSLSFCNAKLYRLEDALKFNKLHLEKCPENDGIWFNQGILYSEMKKYEKSYYAYDKAIKLNPEICLPYVGKGSAASKLEQYDDALICFDEAIKLDSSNGDAWFNKGNVLYKLKNYDGAIFSYNQGLNLNPEDYMALYNKGNILYDLNNFNEALNCYDIMLKLDSNNFLALINKSNCLNKLNRYTEAKKILNNLLKENYDEDNLNVLFNMGDCLFGLDDFEGALKYYDKYLIREPDDAEVLLAKCKTLAKINKLSEAKDCFKKVLDNNEDCEEAKIEYEKVLKLIKE